VLNQLWNERLRWELKEVATWYRTPLGNALEFNFSLDGHQSFFH
jgi:hypothetical protein